MPQRKGKSRPQGTDKTRDPASKALHASNNHLQRTKRTRDPNADEVSTRSTKRPKNDGNVALESHPRNLIDVLSPHTHETTQSVPSEVRRWQDNYEVITMSILSSSKIEQKVRNLLLRLLHLEAGGPKAKPTVVMLHAKGDVAGKMVSIVEIAKAEMRKVDEKLYQYNGLHGETSELKVKKPERTGGGKSVAEWAKEHPGWENHNRETINECGKYTLGTSDRSDDDVEMADATEDAFETMAPPIRGYDPMEARKKVRAYPVLTIYLARVPILELKEIHGEQTNA